MIAPWQKPLRGAQINPAHPLARGLTSCILLNEQTGQVHWDYKQKREARATRGEIPTWEGDALYFDHALESVLVGKETELTDNGIMTVALNMAITTDGNGWPTGCTIDTYSCGIRKYYSGTTLRVYGMANRSSNGNTIFTAPKVNDGNFHTYVAQYAGPAGAFLWEDGVYLTPNTSSARYAYLNDNRDMTFGAYTDHAMRNKVRWFMTWNRILSPEEIQLLNANSYCMFQRDELVPLIVAVTSGGTYVDLAGAIATTPQLAAVLKKYVGLSGSAQITAAASSGLKATRGVSGVIEGGPDIAGFLRAARGLSGAIEAGAGADAAMRPIRGLAGTIDARAELQAYARIYRSLAGVIAAGAGLDGALSLSGVVELSGSIGASAHMGASLRVTLGLAGQVGAPADMAGSLRPFRGLSGAIDAVAGILGAATGVRGLEGSIGIPADLTGGLRAERNLSGSIAATADISGRLRLVLSFSGSIDALAELLAAISTFVPSTLGNPIDLKIESVTPQRTMISITIKRQILEV